MTYSSLRDSGSVRPSPSLWPVLVDSFAWSDFAIRSDRAQPPKKAIVTINRLDTRRKHLKANQRKRRPPARHYGSVGFTRYGRSGRKLELTWRSPAVLATFVFATCAGAYLIFLAPITGLFGIPLSATDADLTVTPDRPETTIAVEKLSSTEGTNRASTFPTVASSLSTSGDASALTVTAHTSSAATPTSAPDPKQEGGKAPDAPTVLEALGISTFLGNNTGAIASWYRAMDPRDDTNGASWVDLGK